MSHIAELKERVLTAEAEVARLQSLVDAFWTGEVPEGGGMDHAMMAQWGRRRLAEKRATKLAALFKRSVA